jgi:general secretion pathway protein C
MISRANWSNITSVDGNSALSAINRVLPPLVSLTLVVIIAWQLARLAWMLVPGSTAGVAVPLPDSLPNTANASNISTDVSSIAGSHIFGVADAAPEGATVAIISEEDDLEETKRINLTLNGTVASEIPRYSVAIISDGGNDQKVYIIGDSVDSVASLHAVYADRVVLNERGMLTSLKLPREFKDSPVKTSRRATSTTRQVSDNANSLQSVVTQNLTRLTDVIRPTPYRVAGEQVGFRVYPGRDRRQFAALGLRPGDIIKDIDGQPLSDASQAMQVFQSLGTAEQVTVTIERNGQSESLVLKTSQLELNDNKNK